MDLQLLLKRNNIPLEVLQFIVNNQHFVTNIAKALGTIFTRRAELLEVKNSRELFEVFYGPR